MRMSDSCGRRRRNTYMEVPEHIIPKWQNSGQYIEERSESAYPLIFEFGQMLFEIDLLCWVFCCSSPHDFLVFSCKCSISFLIDCSDTLRDK